VWQLASKWDELEKWMEGQRLPKGFEVLREPDWVEKFVRKMMTKALPEAAGAITAAHASFSETEQFLLVKYKLPDNTERDQLRLFVREDRLRIEGLPGGKPDIVKLPKLVKPRICKAVVQANTLKVKLRKRPLNRGYHEAAIRW